MSGIGTGGTPLILASPAPSTGGGGGGVTFLNGLTGPLTLTSTGNTISITPSGSTIDLEVIGGGGTPGGTPTQLQFNNTVFGGVAGSAVNASTGEIDLAPPVTGFALSLTGAPDFTPALNINGVGIGIQVISTMGAIGITTNNPVGGDGIGITVTDVDNTNGAFGLNASIQETDSTGSGATSYGLLFQGFLVGTNVDGDKMYGSEIIVTDNSTGGAAAEISGKVIYVAGNGTTTVLATGIHLRRVMGAISNYAILIDPQFGTPAVSTDPGDPSFFGSLFIGGTAGSQPTTAVSWTSGAGAPSGTPVTGSVYSNTTGAAGSSFYVFNGTAWFAVA